MFENSVFLRDCSNMIDDPLSSLLSLINARVDCAGGFVAGGSWAVAFPPPSEVKFFALGRGSCLVAVEGTREPFRLNAGDVFLLTARRSYSIASADGNATARDAHSLFGARDRVLYELGGGDDVLFLGGHVAVEPAGGRFLLEGLPPTIHLRSGEIEADRIGWLVERLVEEHRAALPGAGLARSGLIQLIFLELLRGRLADADPGWLKLAGDPRMAPALRLMHAEPERNWRLPELAKAAAMSRTAFAVRFKRVAGIAPLAYLTEWRMRLAERRLRDENVTIAVLARSLGYTSEAAFSNAFKRVVGAAPKRRQAMIREEAGA